jgi:hypothetical protein
MKDRVHSDSAYIEPAVSHPSPASFLFYIQNPASRLKESIAETDLYQKVTPC